MKKQVIYRVTESDGMMGVHGDYATLEEGLENYRRTINFALTASLVKIEITKKFFKTTYQETCIDSYRRID